jgi:hypothetical protein
MVAELSQPLLLPLVREVLSWVFKPAVLEGLPRKKLGAAAARAPLLW